uniref:Uncharacterized protein n=1 Tax=Taeniopygia guttata TaxID=59729 RepID=A0A674HQI7_TAEGU
MYAKGKGSGVPSDGQAREKLALYVYEYLLHVGAQKSAQTFLSEVRGGRAAPPDPPSHPRTHGGSRSPTRAWWGSLTPHSCPSPQIRWEKNITLGEPPGFLHSWWCVFWDLYCAAPDRRETCEHSSEAKAFHDYVSASLGGGPALPPPPHPHPHLRVTYFTGQRRGGVGLIPGAPAQRPPPPSGTPVCPSPSVTPPLQKGTGTPRSPQSRSGSSRRGVPPPLPVSWGSLQDWGSVGPPTLRGPPPEQLCPFQRRSGGSVTGTGSAAPGVPGVPGVPAVPAVPGVPPRCPRCPRCPRAPGGGHGGCWGRGAAGASWGVVPGCCRVTVLGGAGPEPVGCCGVMQGPCPTGCCGVLWGDAGCYRILWDAVG